MRDAEAEAGLDPRNLGDPYAPYHVPGAEASPYAADFADPFNTSSQALPLVSHASPFQRADMYEDYDERKSLRSEDFDGRSAYTSQRDDASVSKCGQTKSRTERGNLWRGSLDAVRGPTRPRISPGRGHHILIQNTSLRLSFFLSNSFLNLWNSVY